jgi:hypothetical protein
VPFPSTHDRGGSSPKSDFISILEHESLWKDHLEQRPEELIPTIDYSCQSTHFSTLFDFLLRYAKQSPAQSAALFRPLDIWRLSPAQFSQLQALFPGDRGKRFFSSAFQTSPLLAGLANLRAEVSALRISVEEEQQGHTPRWFPMDGDPTILRYLCDLPPARTGGMRVDRYVTITSTGPHTDGFLLAWLRGSEAEFDLDEEGSVTIYLHEAVHAQFTDISVQFGGTAPVVYDSPRRVGWRLELFDEVRDELRVFEFLHELQLDESTAVRHLGGGIRCSQLTLTAMTPFVSLIRLDVFGFVSLPRDLTE